MRRTHVGSLAITSFLVIVLGVLGIGTATAAPTPAPSTGSGESVPGKLLLMLDASGSMLEADPSGLTRMDAAKQGLSAVVDKLPDNAQVGLRVYGATVMGGTPTPEACADTQLVHPIGTIDKTGLKAAINGFAAKGETPIAHSLHKALEDLGTTGKRNIILVSDGEESCVPDPCPVIKELIGNGIDLQIDTVGYAVGDKARQQLQCIADAAHGTYYDAANADQIAASINKLSQRAMRPFRVTGTPIKGTHDAATAPELTAGQYTDAITEGEDAAHQLKYRIKRTIPGSTLHVSTAALPKVSGVVGKEAWSLILDEPGGRNCGMDASGQSSYTSLMALGVSSASSVDACNESESLTLTVTRRYGAESPAPAPFEVRVIEEPRVTNLDQLPDGAGRAKPEVTEVAADGPGTPVVGGTALSDALSLTPGTYVEELVPGEASFYRIPVAYGQRLRVTLLGIGESFPWKTSYRDSWFTVGADILG
ncbi:MAG TPA: VWA domain-containing protein, partial [Actinomycetota bacterium]|nr:VWA domain-containing protein [Actinomycetota bacterium]